MCFQTTKEKVIEYRDRIVEVVKRQWGHAPVATPGEEMPSPKGRIPRNVIKRSPVKTTINMPFKLVDIGPTNSMEPLMDVPFQAMMDTDFDPDDLQVGDVIIYTVAGRRIIHSIVEIAQDEDGRYYRCKGLNNPAPDPFRIRDEAIDSVCLGVLFTTEGN